MITLELRDPGAGVIIRSYRAADCVQFIRSQIRQKQGEAADLRPLDRTSAAILETEVKRLEVLLRIVGRADRRTEIAAR